MQKSSCPEKNFCENPAIMVPTFSKCTHFQTVSKHFINRYILTGSSFGSGIIVRWFTLTATVSCIHWNVSRGHNEGERNDASTLAACQAACVSTSGCTGVHWNPTAVENQRCWLSGHWNSYRGNNSSHGVPHYGLRRSCRGKTAIINLLTFFELAKLQMSTTV